MKRDSFETRLNQNNHGTPPPENGAAAIVRACQLLEQAEIQSCEFLYSGSNDVFLATLTADGAEFKAVYKPRYGEAPLWDFPPGTLFKREYASFLVSQALGWHLIPPTIIREGPHGIGSVQWFVSTMRHPGYYAPESSDLTVLKRVALFDYLVNNADRKAGHFLEDENDRLWVIDHGLTFHTVPKLRTVLWDFAGQAVPGKLLAAVRTLPEKLKRKQPLGQALYRLLEADEVTALERRITKILENPVFTYPVSRRSIPWPWV